MLSDKLFPLAHTGSSVPTDTLRARFLGTLHRQAAIKAALAAFPSGPDSPSPGAPPTPGPPT